SSLRWRSTVSGPNSSPPSGTRVRLLDAGSPGSLSRQPADGRRPDVARVARREQRASRGVSDSIPRGYMLDSSQVGGGREAGRLDRSSACTSKEEEATMSDRDQAYEAAERLDYMDRADVG